MTNALTLHCTRNNLVSNVCMERSSPENMKQYIWDPCFQIVQIINGKCWTGWQRQWRYVIGWKYFGTKLVPSSSGKSVFLIQSWKAKYCMDSNPSNSQPQMNMKLIKLMFFKCRIYDEFQIYWPFIHIRIGISLKFSKTILILKLNSSPIHG